MEKQITMSLHEYNEMKNTIEELKDEIKNHIASNGEVITLRYREVWDGAWCNYDIPYVIYNGEKESIKNLTGLSEHNIERIDRLEKKIRELEAKKKSWW